MPNEDHADEAADFFPQRVTIVGVGLLGASVAAAMNQRFPNVSVTGWARSDSSAERLRQLSNIDLTEVTTDLSSSVAKADVVVVGTPVDHIADLVRQAAIHTPSHTLITDVGSTKANILDDLTDDASLRKFIAAHPIAGSEKSGAAHADATLFDGKLTIVTPHALHDANRLRQTHRFWRSLGCQTIDMPPAEHDQALAMVSHVPHLVSAAVAKCVPDDRLALTGTGWRDITRVAAGDVDMWTAIVMANREAVVGELDRFVAEMIKLRDTITADEPRALADWLTVAKARKLASIALDKDEDC